MPLLIFLLPFSFSVTFFFFFSLFLFLYDIRLIAILSIIFIQNGSFLSYSFCTVLSPLLLPLPFPGMAAGLVSYLWLSFATAAASFIFVIFLHRQSILKDIDVWRG